MDPTIGTKDRLVTDGDMPWENEKKKNYIQCLFYISFLYITCDPSWDYKFSQKKLIYISSITWKLIWHVLDCTAFYTILIYNDYNYFIMEKKCTSNGGIEYYYYYYYYQYFTIVLGHVVPHSRGVRLPFIFFKFYFC